MPELNEGGVLVDEPAGLRPEVNTAQNVDAAPAPDQSSLVTIPMDEAEVAEWWERIELARKRRDKFVEKWDVLMEAYTPSVTKGAEDVKSNLHFRNVHTKIAKIFFKLPELILSSLGPLRDLQPQIDPSTGQPIVDPNTGLPAMITAEQAVPIKQAVLNKKLGRDEADIKWTMEELLFDCLAWAGLGWCKIGYRNKSRMTSRPKMALQADPVTGMTKPMPVLDPVTGQAAVEQVPTVIWEEWYVNRFSPKKGLIPHDLYSSRIDRDASWLGMEFFMPVKVGVKMFNLPEDFSEGLATDNLVYKAKDEPTSAKTDMIHGIELYYRAAVHRPDDEAYNHPDQMCQLVLIDGKKDAPVIHRPSKDQTFDSQGRLTADSMRGFPYEIITLRDMADSPYVWSDSAFTNPQIKHVDTHRQQSVAIRDAAIGKYFYDEGAFSRAEIDKIKSAPVGEYIGVQDGKLAQGIERLIARSPQLEGARDDIRTAQILKADVEDTLGMGGPQVGTTEESGVRTATEINRVAESSNERMGSEKERAVAAFLRIVRKFDALLQRYATEDDYVEITGQDGAKRLALWNQKVIRGPYAYDIKPDSQLQTDAARDRQQKINFLNVAGPDPIVNRPYIYRELSKDMGLDPTQIILSPQQLAMAQSGMPGAQPPMTGGPADQHTLERSGGAPNAGKGDDSRQNRGPAERAR